MRWPFGSSPKRDAPSHGTSGAQASGALVAAVPDPEAPRDHDETTRPRPQEQLGSPVSGKVKWFSQAKRYGFIELADGSGEAFLHAGVIAPALIGAVLPGAILELRVRSGPRGRQVAEVIAIEADAPDAPPRPATDYRQGTPSTQELGTVKWFDAQKGYGFILRDGRRDAFVHASVLQRCGIPGLKEGQRVIVDITDGGKGPEAVSIRPA